MIYGLYLSAQGAELQSTRLDVTANNLANASTTAFKRDLAIFQAHRSHDVERGVHTTVPGQLNESTGGVSVAGVVTDFKDGPLTQTNGNLDLALRGPGFLKVSDGQQEYLTRNGKLATNAAGELILGDTGHQVLQQNDRPIVIPNNSKRIEFGSDGTITVVSGDNQRVQVGRMDIVAPASYADLQKMGNGLYQAQGKVTPAGDHVQVLQGHLEASGVQPITEMMELIQASRGFEANINMIRFQDESLGMLLQSAMRR